MRGFKEPVKQAAGDDICVSMDDNSSLSCLRNTEEKRGRSWHQHMAMDTPVGSQHMNTQK